MRNDDEEFKQNAVKKILEAERGGIWIAGVIPNCVKK